MLLLQIMVTTAYVRIYYDVCIIISYCTYNDHVRIIRDGLIRTGLIYDSTVAQNDRVARKRVTEREGKSMIAGEYYDK